MPTCIKCGAPNPTLHMNRLINGIQDSRHYCTACAELENFPVEIKNAARDFDERQRKTAFDTKVQQFEKALGAKLQELSDRDGRFHREAYDFVFKGLFYALARDRTHRQGSTQHVAADKLVEACEIYAKETWGTSARSQLASWGIKTSTDVGTIVFLLLENGFIGKRQEDKQSDFENLPFLDDQTGFDSNPRHAEGSP